MTSVDLAALVGVGQQQVQSPATSSGHTVADVCEQRLSEMLTLLISSSEQGRVCPILHCLKL